VVPDDCGRRGFEKSSCRDRGGGRVEIVGGADAGASDSIFGRVPLFGDDGIGWGSSCFNGLI